MGNFTLPYSPSPMDYVPRDWLVFILLSDICIGWVVFGDVVRGSGVSGCIVFVPYIDFPLES